MEEKVNIDILYNFEDNPKGISLLFLSFQHIISMFLANITIPILVGTLLNFEYKEISFLIQCSLMCAGLSTLIQVYSIKNIGSKLPIMMGTSNAFLSVVILIIKNYNINVMLGASLIGSILEICIGYNLEKIKKLFNPLISGIIVMTIGITLLPLGFKQSTSTESLRYIVISAIVLVVIIIANNSKYRFIKSSSILIGIFVGCIISTFYGDIDYVQVIKADFISLPKPYVYKLEFKIAPIIAMIFMFIATSIETIGDISAVTNCAERREPTIKELKGGVLADGIGSLISCFYNCFPNTSYTQNIGVMYLTGVFSRKVVKLGAVMLILLSFFPKITTILAIIPKYVLGGASIAMFSMIFVSGITILKNIEFNNRNILIVAMSIGISSGLYLVPEYTMILPQDLQFILTSGVIPAGVISIFLDQVIRK